MKIRNRLAGAALAASLVMGGAVLAATPAQAAYSSSSQLWTTRTWYGESDCWNRVNAKVIDLMRRGAKIQTVNCQGISAAGGGGWQGLILYAPKV